MKKVKNMGIKAIYFGPGLITTMELICKLVFEKNPRKGKCVICEETYPTKKYNGVGMCIGCGNLWHDTEILIAVDEQSNVKGYLTGSKIEIKNSRVLKYQLNKSEADFFRLPEFDFELFEEGYYFNIEKLAVTPAKSSKIEKALALGLISQNYLRGIIFIGKKSRFSKFLFRQNDSWRMDRPNQVIVATSQFLACRLQKTTKAPINATPEIVKKLKFPEKSIICIV